MTIPRSPRVLVAALAVLVAASGCGGTGSPSTDAGARATDDAVTADAEDGPAPTADEATSGTSPSGGGDTPDDEAASREPDDAAGGDGSQGAGASYDGTRDDLEDVAAEAASQLPTGVVPERIAIPTLGVDAPIVELGYESSDAIEVPERAADAGWFTPSRKPGEVGPAIIAGHVDLDGGPAVFFRLEQLEPGDEVVVTGEGGETRTFEVTSKGQYPKDELPDDVFGFGEREPELRLITCGGVFDEAEGHYRDNVVVHTRLVDA